MQINVSTNSPHDSYAHIKHMSHSVTLPLLCSMTWLQLSNPFCFKITFDLMCACSCVYTVQHAHASGFPVCIKSRLSRLPYKTILVFIVRDKNRKNRGDSEAIWPKSHGLWPKSNGLTFTHDGELRLNYNANLIYVKRNGRMTHNDCVIVEFLNRVCLYSSMGNTWTTQYIWFYSLAWMDRLAFSLLSFVLPVALS